MYPSVKPSASAQWVRDGEQERHPCALLLLGPGYFCTCINTGSEMWFYHQQKTPHKWGKSKSSDAEKQSEVRISPTCHFMHVNYAFRHWPEGSSNISIVTSKCFKYPLKSDPFAYVFHVVHVVYSFCNSLYVLFFYNYVLVVPYKNLCNQVK